MSKNTNRKYFKITDFENLMIFVVEVNFMKYKHKRENSKERVKFEWNLNSQDKLIEFKLRLINLKTCKELKIEK